MRNHHLNNSRFDEFEDNHFEKRQKNSKYSKNSTEDRNDHKDHNERQFRCINCGALVIADRELSGVNNRNHCPNCLWSKHVDENKAGDRKASCHSKMQPIGLTVKKVNKKYSSDNEGELMLIHRCLGCGKISINRIASDDSTGALIALYCSADRLSDDMILELEAQKIHPLMAGDLTIVFSQLFGWQSILNEFEGVEKLETLPILQSELKGK